VAPLSELLKGVFGAPQKGELESAVARTSLRCGWRAPAPPPIEAADGKLAAAVPDAEE
jgi:hypothetical protein